MNYPCELSDQPSQPVLSIRTRSAVENLPQVLGQAYLTVLRYLAEIGEQPAGPPFAAYYNMDMQDLDLEIGFPVAKALTGRNEIQPSEIPAGKQATCLYQGPYRQIEPAYQALMQWIQEKGLLPTGAAYEFYLNDPRETPESELLTKIAFPLKG
ncbi:GyrI-like domain-containing protein [Desulforamulus ruminis]|uniref:Transcription activator effector binding protein n=1 Tax=Desulforamulus ruminis (strain ATCC 23193 / DSM 2154 / NCIMB 8452 / DL) TaxID=696281 RepID=F6DLS1_DESRL|nr:GyrI-like domain-containing protein [Desulforamulus ruminis]AEG58364.1 transcription activator effector binding protein [Desulforamulus ruminis DSM 2154]